MAPPTFGTLERLTWASDLQEKLTAVASQEKLAFACQEKLLPCCGFQENSQLRNCLLIDQN